MLANCLTTAHFIDRENFISPPNDHIVLIIWYDALGPRNIVLHRLFVKNTDFDVESLDVYIYG
jgi:hypothetical protein